MAAARYSRWDGTQDLGAPDPQEVFSRLAEDVFQGWDFESALRRLLGQGFQDHEGNRIPGLEGLLEQLRQRRQTELQRYSLESLFQNLEERLDRIVQKERTTLAERRGAALGPDGEGLAGRLLAARQEQLDQLPPETSSAIRFLQNYEFVDPVAEADFRELLEELRRQLVESHLRHVGARLGEMGGPQMARLKEMVSDLNSMLERRLAGEPDRYQQFMERWGGAFPDHPDNLEDFVHQLQQRMAEMESLVQSLSPESRAELEAMMAAALADPGIQEELTQLGQLLSELAPGGRLGGRMAFSGGDGLDFPEAMEVMGRLRRTEELERSLRAAYRGQPLSDEQRSALMEELGPEAASGVAAIEELLAKLAHAGQLRLSGESATLTPQGVRKIGQKALGDVFRRLPPDRFGGHRIDRTGVGVDPGDETKRYEFGDPFRLDVERTVRNALLRGSGPPPVTLQQDDFEVVRSESQVRATTVLMLDMSRSMPLRGYFYAAKKMALALESLIRTQYPRDTLYVVGFSDYAREIPATALAELSYSEYVYGTNLQHGLMVARHLLSRHRGGSRQVIVVSDGEPTAHLDGGRLVFRYPPLPETFQKTLEEVRRCTEERIVINTFMLETNSHLVHFVRQLTRLNRGRAFFVSPDRLGDYVLVDYVSSRAGGV